MNNPEQKAVEALQVAITGLPDDQRQAIHLNLSGLSLDEIAETMNRTEAAVRGLLHRAKRALREAMGRSSKWFSKQGSQDSFD